MQHNDQSLWQFNYIVSSAKKSYFLELSITKTINAYLIITINQQYKCYIIEQETQKQKKVLNARAQSLQLITTSINGDIMYRQLAPSYRLVIKRYILEVMTIIFKQDLNFREEQKLIKIWKVSLTRVKQEITHKLHEEQAKQMPKCNQKQAPISQYFK
ncbi:unnamed protein product (macronuclear) [Paramecium tetraurelia]|uniref:Transmembrane protein n=1 Tax=Paramecium tetraurelia TaxID=5888 RepID=A0BW29_PARTE|nr:uncharacterized protein GSPATT00032598001 [Paramecium tetraurelia]CAK62746.1 unnamed protein product [Paramecium tetraurelia]|eukprot:XP_001430144.1 hypothetical protein (macronuclear) [Paramecium tetraurelia strain d4-2]